MSKADGMNVSLPMKTRLNIAIDIATSLQFLRVCDVVHRSISSNSVLLYLNDNHEIAGKLMDFSTAHIVVDHPHLHPHPHPHPHPHKPQRQHLVHDSSPKGYSPPECRDLKTGFLVTSAQDVFAFGSRLLLQLAVDDFIDGEDLDVLQTMDVSFFRAHIIRRQRYHHHLHHHHRELHAVVIFLLDIVEMCWKPSPTERPSPSQIIDTIDSFKRNEMDGKAAF